MCKKKGSKNTYHVEYICECCLKNFGCRKHDYIRHKNKIKPCEKKNIQIDIEKNNHDVNNINNINEIEQIESYNNNNNNNKTINKSTSKIIIQNPVQTELLEKINFLIDQVQILKDENEKLKTQVSVTLPKFNSTGVNMNMNMNTFSNTNSNSGIINTNTNSNNRTTNSNKITNNIQVVNFNSIDYSKIEKKKLLENLIKEQGKQIYLKTISDIFFDETKPENHNIYINDKNRKYVKLFNDGRWETKSFNIIDLIINNITGYYKLSIDEIKNDEKKYQRLKNIINTKIKYINFCDLEYLADLEEEHIQDNGNEEVREAIQRCKDFRKMVYEEIINLLHDKKDIIINTHKNNSVCTI